MCSREIITLQVGQAGNQVGTQFWDAIRKEHKLGVDGKVAIAPEAGERPSEDELPDALVNMGVMFHPTDAKDTYEAKWVPRGILVDLEPGVLDEVKSHALGPLFRPNNMIFGNSGAGNNWAKGYYTDGQELMENTMDRIRRETEQCDAMQGFQLFHSIGGGTGSGLGTLILNNVRDHYVDRITTSYSVFPSAKVSQVVVEPYNSILAIHQLIENSDETFILDNEAIQNIATNILHLKKPNMQDLNLLISQITCGVTSSIRFPGTLNSDLRKLGVNLIPFPRLHFFHCSQAPIASKESSDRTKLNIRQLVSQAFSAGNFFCAAHPEDGKYMASAMLFRGPELREQEVDDCIFRLIKENSDDFVEWIPNNLLSSLIRTPPDYSILSSTMIANSTCIKGIFQRLATQFGAMYRRKAFLHFYKNEGMDEMEFEEADKNVRDLIMEYGDKQDPPQGYLYYSDEDLDEGI